MKAALFNPQIVKFAKMLNFNHFLFNSNSEIAKYRNNYKNETPLVRSVKSNKK